MAIVTSTAWKALRLGYYDGVDFVEVNAEPAGWKDAGFDDSAWDTVQSFVRAEHDVPFIARTADASTRGDEILYRKEVYIEASVLDGPDAVFQYAIDNGGEIYVNGSTVVTLGTPYTPTGSNITSDHATTIARSEFVEGWNAVGIYAWNDRLGVDGESPPGFCAGALRIELNAEDTPGVSVEWDGVFSFERVREWTITRGASAELTGTTQAGGATILLVNTPDDRYNPENTTGDLYGLLHDGPRVHIAINEDGTIEPDAGKDVYGLHAGRITDISPIPEPGAAVAPFVEIVTEDSLGWYERQRVRLADSTTRSQADLRLEVLTAVGETDPDLPAEPTTLPLSRADGNARGILDALNAANGTRHYIKPQPNAADWGRYTAIRRTSLLDGTSDASLNHASQHVIGTSGWRTSADGVINQQKASVEEVSFPARIIVWQHDTLPLTVEDTTLVLWADFGDYVKDAEVFYTATGSPTVTLTPFGDTAKIEITATGEDVFTRLEVRGYLVQRGSVISVTEDDLDSQAEPRGVRSGPDLTGDYLGTLTAAQGFAQHIVWRFGNPLYRPTLTVVNWFPEMFALDIGSRIAVTSSQLKVDARIFEIVGLTHHGVHAAADDDGDPTAVYHEVTYVLQESRVQSPKAWFTLDQSLLDGDDVLAY